MTEDDQQLALAFILGGFALAALVPKRPKLVLQDYASVPLPNGWPALLKASQFAATSVKIGYGPTIKRKAEVAEKLDLAESAGLERHGSWWVVSRTMTDAERDGATIARACVDYRCKAIHLNAEKSFWGNREANSGGPCPDVPGRMRMLVSQIRAGAPGVEVWWNGYHSAVFTNAAGQRQKGISAAEMRLCDVFEPMAYVWDSTPNATSESAHAKQAEKWRALRTKFPGVRFSPMVFQGCWNGESWLGTSRPTATQPGLAELVAELRPDGVSFWRWRSSKYPDQLTEATAASPSMRELGPQLHQAYSEGTAYAMA